MSSGTSGHDTRAHVRADSVAYQRRAPSSPEKPSRTGATRPLTGPSAANAATDALSSLQSRRRRKLLLRVALFLSALFLVYQFLSTWTYDHKVSTLIKARKARLEGTGESHVLPKRWREHDAGEAVVSGEALPMCKRVLLFKFTNTHGFASEVNAYLRAAVISSKLGYTLLADDSEWNYGSLRNYFVPRPVYCRPPADWFLTEAATPLGSKKWQGEDRVWFSREILSMADDWIREETLDPDSMRDLQERKLGTILPEGETLPAALEEVFVDFQAALKELWKPNDELAIMIRRQRMELGLGEGGLRHRKNSPTWGGNRRQGDSNQRAAVEDVEEEEHDYDEAGGAERSDRGPVIGAHVGLKNKQPKPDDLRVLGIVKPNHEGNYSATLQGVQDAVRRLSKSSIAEPSYSRNHPTIFPSSATPVVVVMTGESSIVDDLTADDLALNMTVQRTSLPPFEELRQWNEVLRLELNEDIGPPAKGVDGSRILTAWKQETFNALPKGLRVHLTKYFLRDLTTLALYADAFVVHGSSNVGRLAMLIAGEDAIVGPREISGSGLGGRVRSVDGWWFPSSVVGALWEDEDASS